MSFSSLLKARMTANKKLEKFRLAVENCRREKNGEEPELTRCQQVKRSFSWLCPTFDPKLSPSNWYHRIFFKGTFENAIFRLIRNVMIVELFGLLMYFVMAFKYVKDPSEAGVVVSLGVHIPLMVMLVFPVVMNYFMLSVYRMMSSKIKTLLIIVIISIAFEVPAMNALTNLHRVAQGVACVQMDVSESASAVDENIAKRGEMGLELLQNLVRKLAKPMNYFKGMMRKLDTKVTKVVEVVREHWAELSDLTNKCKRAMRGPYLVVSFIRLYIYGCLNKFYEAYLFCTRQEIFLGLDLCSSVQRANKICDMGKSAGDSVCQFPQNVKNGIAESAVPYFKKSWSDVKEKVKNAHFFKIGAVQTVFEKGKWIKKEIKNLATLNLRIEEKHQKTSNIKTLRENLKKTLDNMIETYKSVIRLISSTIHWILIPVTLFYPFFTTGWFVYKYNYRDNYRNTFLTSEFDKIDSDCAMKGYSRVMPLSREEKDKYVKRMRWKMTAKEKRKFFLNLGLSTTAVFWPAVLVFLDLMTYIIISAVHDVFERTTVEFPAHYELKVATNSSGGDLLNVLLETFSPITNGIQEREQRWRNCFKEPNPPNGDAILLMFFLFILVLFLCRLGVWLGRQSLVLADYFYPDRVRPRALHLYNKILQERRHLMTFMYSKQRAVLADDQMAGREQLVRRGLQSRGFVRVNCVKCRATQMRLSDEANVRLCVNCGTFYCISCFSFTHWCLDCEEDMQLIDKMELYYETLTEDELTEEEEDDEEEDEVTAEEGDFTSKESTSNPPEK